MGVGHWAHMSGQVGPACPQHHLFLFLPCYLPRTLTPLLLPWQGVKDVPFLRDHLVIHLMNIY